MDQKQIDFVFGSLFKIYDFHTLFHVLLQTKSNNIINNGIGDVLNLFVSIKFF